MLFLVRGMTKDVNNFSLYVKLIDQSLSFVFPFKVFYDLLFLASLYRFRNRYGFWLMTSMIGIYMDFEMFMSDHSIWITLGYSV